MFFEAGETNEVLGLDPRRLLFRLGGFDGVQVIHRISHDEVEPSSKQTSQAPNSVAKAFFLGPRKSWLSMVMWRTGCWGLDVV